MGLLRGQLLVVGEVMGADTQGAHAWIIGEMHGDRRSCPASGAMLIDEVATA
jgi:hypothetical protein